METSGWLDLLKTLVVIGLVVYVLVREARTDERVASTDARDRSSEGPGALFPRLGARLIDDLPFWIAFTILGVLLELGHASAVSLVVVVYAYFVLLDTYAGTTLGKRLLRLRVVGPSGDKPTLKQAALREAFILVGVIPVAGEWLATVATLVIAWTISSSPVKQGKHDQIAGGTRVVRRTIRTSGEEYVGPRP